MQNQHGHVRFEQFRKFSRDCRQAILADFFFAGFNAFGLKLITSSLKFLILKNHTQALFRNINLQQQRFLAVS